MEKGVVGLKNVLSSIIKLKYWIIGIIVFSTCVGLFFAFTVPNSYESSIVIRFKDKPNAVATSMELLKNDFVVGSAIEQLNLNKSRISSGTQEEFVKKHLKIQNARNTDLITITGISGTPEEARQIAEAMVAALARVLHNEQIASIIPMQDKYFSERVLDQAKRNFEAFRKNSDLVSQSVEVLARRLAEYDEIMATLKNTEDSSDLKLKRINQLIQEANVQFNTTAIIETDANISLIKDLAIKELELMDVRGKYGNEYPTVFLLVNEINQLNKRLEDNLKQSIETTGLKLKPYHESLFLHKARTEMIIAKNKIQLEQVEKRYLYLEEDAVKLSGPSATYVGLFREMRLSQSLYNSISARFENLRKEGAVESIGFQIVSPANSPVQPTGPARFRIALMSFIAGILLSIGYVCFYIYSRRLNLLGMRGEI